MAPYLISFFIALGVYFLGKFIGKRFTNFHESSYLGFAIISFILAFILHTKVQNTILKTLVNYPFIDRRTIISFTIALGIITILFICLGEVRRKTTSKPLSIRALNPWIADKPHKCSHCGYSFSIMPKLEDGTSCLVKNPKCPNCGNVDEMLRFYKG